MEKKWGSRIVNERLIKDIFNKIKFESVALTANFTLNINKLHYTEKLKQERINWERLRRKGNDYL